MNIFDQEKCQLFREQLVWLARTGYELHENEKAWIPWAQERIRELESDSAS